MATNPNKIRSKLLLKIDNEIRITEASKSPMRINGALPSKIEKEYEDNLTISFTNPIVTSATNSNSRSFINSKSRKKISNKFKKSKKEFFHVPNKMSLSHLKLKDSEFKRSPLLCLFNNKVIRKKSKYIESLKFLNDLAYALLPEEEEEDTQENQEMKHEVDVIENEISQYLYNEDLDERMNKKEIDDMNSSLQYITLFPISGTML